MDARGLGPGGLGLAFRAAGWLPVTEPFGGSPVQLADGARRYLVQLEADGRAASTVAQYERHLRLLGCWLAGAGRTRDIRRLTHEDIAHFLTSPWATRRPDGAPKKATAMNVLRSSLRAFFGYLHAAGMTPRNAAALVRRARCAPPPPRALAPSETERLLATLAAADGPLARRDHALFHLMLATGIRVGSAVAIEVADLDLEQGYVRLRQTKGNRPDLLPLGDAIRDHLRAYARGQTIPSLFPGSTGQAITTRQVSRRLSFWLDKAGLRTASPHALRHTFARRLYEQSKDVLLVQEALGHRSVSSTCIYAARAFRPVRRLAGG